MNIDANVQKAINSLIKRWKLLILFALIGALAAFIITANFTTLTYTSSIEFLAYAVDSDQELTESATSASSQSASSQRTSNTSKMNYAMKMLDTYIEIFSTNDFNQSVADTLNRTYGTDYSTASIKNSIVISQIENTAMFVFEITTTDADLSYHIAQTLQKCVPETMANTNQGLVLAEIQDSSQRAAAAESMQYPKKYLIGALIGIIIAGLYAVLRDFLDIRIKGSDDLTEKYGIPVLGSVPDFSAANSKKQKKKRRNK